MFVVISAAACKALILTENEKQKDRGFEVRTALADDNFSVTKVADRTLSPETCPDKLETVL